MKDYWIFPTLMAILIITIYFESGFFWIGLILLILRVIWLKNHRVSLGMLVIGGVFLIRCQWLQQVNISQVPKLDTVLISPDKINLNGDILSGELQAKQQTVRFVYRIKTHAEQREWQQLSEIIQAKLKVKKIEPLAGPRNSGEFDFKKYAGHKNIHYSVQIDRFLKIRTYQPRTILEKINVLRIHIINYLARLPKWLRIHAQSLIVGYNQTSDKDFLQILSVLGVIHLFSLSGLHVLILLTLLRKLTSSFLIPVEWVDDLMLIILPCYGFLVGSKSGIWRAIVLAIVSIIVKKAKWSLSKLDIFSVTMLICLLIYPFAIVEMGGQLSFLLSFAILYLYRQTSFWLTAFKMNLVSLPVIGFYTYQFNWLTLLANIFFVPFFSYVILPVTVISSLTVDWNGWQSFNLLFDWLYKIMNDLATNLRFIFVTGKFASWMVVFLVIISLFYVESKSFINKYLKVYLGIFGICILINKFPVFGAVNLIDVGQGDSILITTPLNRQTYLIDVGGKLQFKTPTWAKHISSNQVDNNTIPFLKSQGISHIDKLFLTHKDVDHIGNLETLLSKFQVNEVNFGIGLESNSRIRDAIRKYPQVRFKNLRQGDVIDTGVLKWHILWPKVKSKGENGDSLTLLVKLKHKNWLFTGDLDQAGEKKILEDHHFKVDYLKVGHHGSRTSTSEQLLRQLRPEFGLISSGVNNRYGHPNQETLDRLKQHRVRYFNTAEYGMITWCYYFWNDNEKLTTFLKGDLLENN